MSRRGAPYARVCPSIWQESKRKGWGQDENLLALYLLTCPHKTTEGLFELPLAYALADLPSTWNRGRFKRAMDTLMEAGFVEYDWDSSVVLIPDAMRHQRPDAPGQVTAAIRKIAALPETRLWSRFMDSAQRYAPALHETLLDHFPHGMSDGMCDDMGHSQALALALAPAPSQSQDSSPISETQSQDSGSSSGTHTQDSSSELDTQAPTFYKSLGSNRAGSEGDYGDGW